MSRHSSRLAIQSPQTPRNGLSFTLAYVGAALIAPRSRPVAWKRVRRPLPLALWVPLALAAWCMPMARAAEPLPQGGTFVRGQGAMSIGTTSLTIVQSSSRGVIDWHSFSIGNGNTVAFSNGAGATLNRITGGDPSSIFGKLTATGSLYLINPQGILVGPSGVVSTGGRFVASTLDICNDAFIQGGDALTLSGTSDASVINLGRISSSGGDVFLIARQAVINAGTVKAPSGTVELAAGETVLLQDSASSRQVFVQAGSQGTVANKGFITAAQVSLQAADGNVYALAGSGTRIRATGTASRDGHVWLVAESGRVEQRGTISAHNADASGGTVDTQATQLAFGRHAMVDAGQWNASTPAFTIDAAAARALRRSLNKGTSVDVTTTGSNGAGGDLDVASSLAWHGAASLTLTAYHNVSVANGTTVANDGAGNLILRADATSIGDAGSVTNRGTIDWSHSTGTVSAFYDMNGAYTAGTQRTNPAWTPLPFSGLLTQSTAYKLVNSGADLDSVAGDLAGIYALGTDVNADGAFVPIGNANTPFTGQFDGMGHRISSLPFSDFSVAKAVPAGPGSDGQNLSLGLFGQVGTSGVVRNLTVNGSIFAPIPGYAGVLAAVNYGTIVNDHTNFASEVPYAASIGGLVGWNAGTIERSSTSVAILGENRTGDLVGTNAVGGKIIQSFATGQVAAAANVGAGGLVGSNAGLIMQSYATGPVFFSPAYCGQSANACMSNGGGLVLNNTGTIEQSFATGAITSVPLISPPAGIADSNQGVIAAGVFWNKQTTGATVGVVLGKQVPATNGLTTAQMSQPASFGPTYDFGPNGVWAMPVGATHPVLRWQLGQ
ncbi:two-partner secretion domain-containing protein [Paraburkholderia strydomiana]|jgi:filamentous hemagglutinin family protein